MLKENSRIVYDFVKAHDGEDFTAQDIADATGIKRANIARLELKKNEASLDSLVRYAKSMKLDLSIELEGMKEVS